MALRGKKPEDTPKRLKLFIYGEAGVGKTTAAIQMPKPYIIDCEHGTDFYADLINKSGGQVFHASSLEDVIAEVRALRTEKHDFLTLIIDPISTAYLSHVDTVADTQTDAESKKFSNEYQEANKVSRRLYNMLLTMDMNVVLTAHAKVKYVRTANGGLDSDGLTYQAMKDSDYPFDLVLFLERIGKKRMARIAKTRIKAFPDQESFEWSYKELQDRYDVALMERDVNIEVLASKKEVAEVVRLIGVLGVDKAWEAKVFRKAKVSAWEDLPQDKILAVIADFEKKIKPEEN